MFQTVIGLEIHVQLKTKSKMFCGCNNNAENAAPNTLVCPVCLGLPGVLPVPNAQAIEWTLKTGQALNCQIGEFAKFDRKHYFYPDLPKGYQISQYDAPFLLGGYLEIPTDSGTKKIRLIRIHLEEDAGKLLHDGNDTLVDLNRAGTPLMEIVTEPDISSPQEAKTFLQVLRSILRYLDVSDADMEKGHLRADANISITDNRQLSTNNKLGTPVEIKNLNSFRSIERALIFEEKRQIGEIEAGRKIVKETRGWNDAKGETISQRSKEQAQDYRYFPEPDIPPYFVKKVFNLDKIKNELPELPQQKQEKYVSKMGIPLQDAQILAIDKQLAEYFEQVAKEVNPKIAANWIINELKSDAIIKVSPEYLIELLQMLQKEVISGKIAKEVMQEMTETGAKASQIVKEKNLAQTGDVKEIGQIIEKVIKENPQPVADYKNGKMAAFGFLVGQIMKQSRGKANPAVVNKILKEKID